MNVLSVSHAIKSFGAVKALDGVSFDLHEGELLALLGPNGAGKTTLIRAIAGRVRLDAGDVCLFGTSVTGGRTPPALGIVPQEIALYPLLTARENLGAFGALQGLSGRELADRVDWALDRTGLADRAREPIKQFSGGMKRRLNIACGVLHRPRVVLLDEPTVGVDPQSRDRIYDMLSELAAGGTSLLLTTHHLEEAEARCSRTVIIDHGRTIADGTLPELVDRAVDAWLPELRRGARAGGAASPGATAPAQGMGIGVEVVDVMRATSNRGALISFYAAGTGVMFLLFSSMGGASGTLLEEVESGTLERLLSTKIGMTGLLAGKWVFLAVMGALQLCVMFLWAALAFGLPLFSHLAGFLTMTIVTAGAAAALALVLATIARSRAQLSGFSTILILTMSALGGSMFPRFLMSDTMQKIGLVTFNAWALDGYLKVFWRDAPLWQLWPQLAVLVGSTLVFLAAAHGLARRWETA